MKKIFLIAIASLSGYEVYAQSEIHPVESYTTNELHCTEEAFTFKANIRSGWHLSSVHMGDMTPENTSFDTKSITQDSALPSNFEAGFDLKARSFEQQSTLRQKTALSSSIATIFSGRTADIHYDYARFLQPKK